MGLLFVVVYIYFGRCFAVAIGMLPHININRSIAYMTFNTIFVLIVHQIHLLNICMLYTIYLQDVFLSKGREGKKK